MEKYAHFIAAGRSLEAIHSINEKHREQTAKTKVLIEELGAVHSVTQAGIAGFTFKDDKHPEGWRKAGRCGGKTYFSPYRRSKADKELWKRFADANPVSSGDIDKLFIGDSWGVMTDETGSQGGIVIRHCSLEQIFDTWIIGIPLKGGKPFASPDDAKHLKNSEYWALKEAQDETKDK